MTADGGEILSGQGNVKMAPLGADGSVQTDDFTVIVDFADGNTAGIPDTSLRDTSNSGQNHTCGNLLFPAELPDGLHQIIPAAQADTVAF